MADHNTNMRLKAPERDKQCGYPRFFLCAAVMVQVNLWHCCYPFSSPVFFTGSTPGNKCSTPGIFRVWTSEKNMGVKNHKTIYKSLSSVLNDYTDCTQPQQQKVMSWPLGPFTLWLVDDSGSRALTARFFQVEAWLKSMLRMYILHQLWW